MAEHRLVIRSHYTQGGKTVLTFDCADKHCDNTGRIEYAGTRAGAEEIFALMAEGHNTPDLFTAT